MPFFGRLLLNELPKQREKCIRDEGKDGGAGAGRTEKRRAHTNFGDGAPNRIALQHFWSHPHGQFRLP